MEMGVTTKNMKNTLIDDDDAKQDEYVTAIHGEEDIDVDYNDSDKYYKEDIKQLIVTNHDDEETENEYYEENMDEDDDDDVLLEGGGIITGGNQHNKIHFNQM